jgi:polyhydroxybutyrate depolymerase
MPRTLALYLACLPVACALPACTDTGTLPPSASESSAPSLMPNRDLQMPTVSNPAQRIDESGSIASLTATESDTQSDAVPADPIPEDPAPIAEGAPPEDNASAPPAAEPPEVTPPSEAEAEPTVEGSEEQEGAAPAAAADPGEPDDSSSAELGEELNSPTPVTPSAGCDPANPEPAQGLASLMIRGLAAEYLLTLPEGYDGSQALPLIFAFHGRARTYQQFEQVDASGLQSELGSRAILVYPQAQGGEGWTNEGELEPSLEFFDSLYAQLLANYCVDRSHVFAVGHSSGGFFSHSLACRYGERLRGIGVVAGTLLESECSGYVAAVMIHGVRDSVVDFSRGASARDFLLTRNGCTPDTLPGPDGPCVTYQGCEPGLPIAWCEHDEPTYDDTNHGWPSFASHTIADFLFSLP